jgi:hypothetical protein
MWILLGILANGLLLTHIVERNYQIPADERERRGVTELHRLLTTTRQSNAKTSAAGPFWNRSKLLDEAKLAIALSAITPTSAHVPQRKIPRRSVDAQYRARPRTMIAPATSVMAANALATRSPTGRWLRLPPQAPESPREPPSAQNISQPATTMKAIAATVAAKRGARLAIVTR